MLQAIDAKNILTQHLSCQRCKRVVLLSAIIVTQLAADAILKTPTLYGTLKTKSFKELRDQNVVKQQLDYSCGPASVATILSHYYTHQTTEQEIILKLNQWSAASFADITRVLPEYGYKGVGIALNAEKLRKIKMPAIVYLRHNNQDHFSVLKGVNDDNVYLADPSWGNVRFRWSRFLSMWETREDEAQKGKILLIVPLNSANAAAPSDEFFSKENVNYFDTEILTYRQPHRNF